MIKRSRGAAILASAAAFTMMATPALARGGPGWGGGRHHDRIDGDDILTGILVLGGIAVLASAASSAAKSASRPASYPPRDRRDDDGEYRGYGTDNRPVWNQGGGINAAVNTCMDEIDRGRARVDSVDGVTRDGAGWRVTGQADGGTFSCSVGGDGRIVNVNINGQAI